MRLQRVSPDALIAEIAARQHGVVTFGQLIGAGLSQSGIQRRVAAGRLHRVHKGVYAVGHSGLSQEGEWTAAVLACGAGAVLSHRSAAELWELVKPFGGPIHVTVRTPGGRARRRGLRTHRSPSLPDVATTHFRGIAVTTPARTLADLAVAISAGEHRQAIREAEFRGYATGLETDGTRSEPEAAFLRLCRRHRLAMPEANVPIGRFTVDFLWRERHLVVEVDGYKAHRGRQAFEDDRGRELELGGLGYRVRRFSAAQIAHRSDAVAALMRAELAGGEFQSVGD